MSITASCLFCDDIREEQTGKDIYVGIYKGRLIAPRLPAKMPSFCVVVTIRAPIGQEFTLDALIIEPPGEEKREIQKHFKTIGSEPKGRASEAVFHQISAKHKFENVSFHAEGRLRVWAKVDGNEIYAGSLEVVEGVDRDAFDLQSFLVFISLYNAWKEVGENIDDRLSVDIMSELSEIVPIKPEINEDRKGYFILQKSEHEYKGYYFHPYSRIPKIRAKVLPKTLKPKITNVTKFSFDIKFEKTDEPVQEINIEIVERT